MNWLIILVALLAIYIATKIIHFRHLRHRITAIVLILLVLFVYLTFAGVVKSNNIDLKTAKGAFEAGKVYALWLGQAFVNVKEITGNVVKMEWLPRNMSSSVFSVNSNSKDSPHESSPSASDKRLPSLS